MEFSRYNAFCTEWGHGNPAVIVQLEEDQSYSDDTLQTIAQDMLCEVGFVLNPDTYKTTGVVRMRYFTAAKVELKFIGHVSIAALIFLANTAAPSTSVTTQSKGGDIPATVTGGLASFEIPAPTDIYEQSVPEDLLRAAIGNVTIDERIPTPMYAYGTSSRLIIFVKNLDVVAPDMERIIDVSNHARVSGVFVVELAPDGATTRSRMFCPLIGVSEDACSGNAHGLLGFVLSSKGLLPPNNKFIGKQGASVGRPSTVNVAVNPALKTANVGGTVATFC